MKYKYLTRLGCTAICAAIAVSVTCGCSTALPHASQSTATQTQSLYDSSALNDGQLHLLAPSGNGLGATMFCGDKIVCQADASDTLSIVYNYNDESDYSGYFVHSYPDSTSASGRHTAICDATGTELLGFANEMSVSLSNGVFIVTDDEHGYSLFSSIGDIRLFDAQTLQEISVVPDNAYNCIITPDYYIFSTYSGTESNNDTFTDIYDDPSICADCSVVIQPRSTGQAATVINGNAGISIYTTIQNNNWILLDSYENGSITDTLYCPGTGETISGYESPITSNIICVKNDDGKYQLLDLSSDSPAVIAESDNCFSAYAPGYAVICYYDASGTYHKQLYNLTTGDIQDIYDFSSSASELAIYYQDGSLKTYDAATGSLVSEATVEPVDNAENAAIYLESDDGNYVDVTWNNYDDGSSVERFYFPNGTVYEFDSNNSKYTYITPITTASDGTVLFRGSYNGIGNSYLFDIIDGQGNVVLSGLSDCSNNDSKLPEGYFYARKGFYYGWMNSSGEWLYCRSIFSTLAADDAGNLS